MVIDHKSHKNCTKLHNCNHRNIHESDGVAATQRSDCALHLLLKQRQLHAWLL
jgi:hypothetical protein